MGVLTEKVEVAWGSEYIVTPDLQGTWIEVKYVKGEGMNFDFKKKSVV